MSLDASTGRPYPLGATPCAAGVNFALYSEHAESVTVCLYDAATDGAPARCVRLGERTGHVRHGLVRGLRPGQIYGYRVEGPWSPDSGHRFDRGKILLDPYARAIARVSSWGPDAYSYEADDYPDAAALGRSASFTSNAASAPLGIVTGAEGAGAGFARPRTSWGDTLIYEAHVRGLTKLHPEVAPEQRGTFAGLVSEPVLDHLRRLGVTAIELLPVQHHVDEHRLEKLGLTNYWGYQPLAYFAPEPTYSSVAGAGAVAEFREMVRRFHAAGIEVILDVVYNHTGELGHDGPTLSFRGIDNATYYRLQPDDKRRYVDLTGCGNTLSTGHPAVVQLVLDSMRYWVTQMGVDGFRFDLAAALGRGGGAFDPWSPVFSAIRQDPALRGIKLIAEPWDLKAGGGCELGRFPVEWSEWNCRFRDDVRRFWRGDSGLAPALATRLAGSSDLFGTCGRSPHASVNFVTAHDGFTLADLVSYSGKRNVANGEGGRDGHDGNHSWNCGREGPTSDEEVMALRERQQRNLLATLLLSLGVPMLTSGDEFGRTQRGNNNAYCQDNEVSWVDWSMAHGSPLVGFTAALASLRRTEGVFRKGGFFDGEHDPVTGQKDIAWIRPEGTEISGADWSDPDCSCLGAIYGGTGNPMIALLLNVGGAPCDFALPSGSWILLIDTWTASALPVPHSGRRVRVHERSLVLLREVR